MEPKVWWASKLMWLGLVEAAFGIYDLVKDGSVTGDDWEAIVKIVGGILVIVFRGVTHTGIANRVL